MKRIFALCLCSIVGCVAKQPVQHVAPVAATAPQTASVTIHLCNPADDRPECEARRRQWNRKKDEKDLIELLLEDFRDTSTLPVNGRRDRINALMARLAKNNGD